MNAMNLLDQALMAMEKLHESMIPNNNEEQDATVPAFAVREFVDAHAALLSERKRLSADSIAIQSVRINPFQHIKEDPDFMMTLLVKMAQTPLPPEHASLAKEILLREAKNGEVTVLAVVEAFEAEPTLAAFGATLRKVAIPGSYEKIFESPIGDQPVWYLDEAKYLLNEGRRIGVIDSTRKD